MNRSDMKSRVIHVLAILLLVILILYYSLLYYGITERTDCGIEPFLSPRLALNVKLNQTRDAIVDDKILSTRDPEDPILLNLLREGFIDGPNQFQTKVSYVLFKTPQATVVDKLLEEKKGGFFIECGALDGERSSNSLWLELERKWTGLLIEMDPSYYMQLRGKNRKAHSINACLSPKPYPQIITFKEHMKGEGKIITNSASAKENRELGVRKTYCFPFLSLMRAMNVTHVDYLSLDVEGFEYEILQTIPFDKIDISILSVEYNHQKNPKALKTFMQGQGYNFYKQIDFSKPEIYFGAHDYIFVKRTLPIKV